jgi:hypothetical protein
MFNPPTPARKNLRPNEGMASNSATDFPASAKRVAAINPAGPAPMITASTIMMLTAAVVSTRL